MYAVGAVVEGVRLPAARWAEAAGWSLLALAPFVALGIWLGHRLTVDVLGPLSGALFTALGILGGVWFPIDQLPSAMQGLAKALPSYWLAQAGREPLAGSWIGWHGVSVLALWTAVFAAPRRPRLPAGHRASLGSTPWRRGLTRDRCPAGARLPAGPRPAAERPPPAERARRWRLFAGIWLVYLLPGFATAWTEHTGADRWLRLPAAGRVLLRLRRPGRPGADRRASVAAVGRAGAARGCCRWRCSAAGRAGRRSARSCT